MDPVQVSTFGAFAEKFGFPALLVLALLFGLWKMSEAHGKERKEWNEGSSKERETREQRDEAREAARRAEREADRKAHLDALGQQTSALTTLGTGFIRLEQKVDSISDDVDDLKAKSKGA